MMIHKGDEIQAACFACSDTVHATKCRPITGAFYTFSERPGHE